MLRVIALVISRDAENFTQILKKFNFTKFLSQIFGKEYNFDQLKKQSDPLYYLEIANRIIDPQVPLNLTS